MTEKTCSQCDSPALPGRRLCEVHTKHDEWLDNSNKADMGIVRFSHELFEERINDRYGTPEMHINIYADLLDAIARGKSKMDRLHVIAAPREHSKSTIIGYVFVLYCILFNLKRYIVIISESQEKAEQFLRAIKRALASPLVRHYFGDVRATNMAMDGGKWAESHMVTSTGVHIKALGMGKSTRGLIEETRPDLIIGDDCESENNTKTEETREGNRKWWTAQVEPAGDMINGQCVYIGTMVHNDCVLAHLLEQSAYRKQFYQVWLDEKRTRTLWPAKFPPALVWQIEAKFREDPKLGLDLFYMEYMNIAQSPQSQRFGPSSIVAREFQFVMNDLGKWVYDEVDDKYYFVETFLGIDPAISQKQWAAFTVVMAIAVTPDGHIYILDYRRGHFDIRDDKDSGRKGTIEQTMEMIRLYRPERVAIEVSGLGQPIANEMRREMRKLREEHPEIGFPSLVELRPPPDMSKVERIANALVSPHHQRMVYQRADMDELKVEQEQFPKARTFDCLDAEANCLQIAHPPYRVIDYDARVKLGLLPSSVAGEKLDWEVL